MAHADQEALLRLQALDTTADQARHRRSHCPEVAAVKQAEQRAVAAKSSHDELAREVAVLRERQATLEGEIDRSEHRATDIDARMRSGEITAARDVVRMQEEIDHLRARAEQLEVEGLEVLEQLEARDEDLGARAAALQAAVEDVMATRRALLDVQAECDRVLDTLGAERQQLADAVPEGLLSLYERIRAKVGGVGAARLEGGQCTGCHVSLSPYDLEQLRKAAEDTVMTCDNCGRILVR